MLDKVLKLAEKLSEPWENHDPKMLAQSAAAIRALVEVAKCADRIWYDDSEDNKADLACAILKLEEFNDGLEV